MTVTEAVTPVSNVIRRNRKHFSLCASSREERGYFALCVSHWRLKRRQMQKTHSNYVDLYHIRLCLLQRLRRAFAAFRIFNRIFYLVLLWRRRKWYCGKALFRKITLVPIQQRHTLPALKPGEEYKLLMKTRVVIFHPFSKGCSLFCWHFCARYEAFIHGFIERAAFQLNPIY
jgi:hypothetical protein